MLRIVLGLLSILSLNTVVVAQPAPVGLITAVQAARLIRSGTTTRLNARGGDVLFPGDRLVAEDDASVTFAFCPAARAYSLTKASVEIGAARIQSLDGRPQPGMPLPFCELPSLKPGTMASFDFYLAKLRRDSKRALPRSLADLTSEQRKQLADVDEAVRANPDDLAARTARALRLERFGLLQEAVADFEEIGRRAAGAVWARAAARQAAVKSVASESSRSVGGTTYAVVVGNNSYPHLPDQELQFAEDDAKAFYQHLTGRRGGVLKENVTLLLDENATLAAVQDAIGSTFARTRENDVVVLYAAVHGIAPAEDDGISNSYLLTYDSDHQNLGVTAVPMSDIQNYLVRGKAREVRVFIDSCKSGRLASIEGRSFGREARNALQGSHPSQVVALMATRSRENSYECANYRHGAFTYFVLRGLETDEAGDPSGKLTVDALSHYVTEHVRAATGNRQTPITNPNLPGQLVLRHDAEQAPELAFPAGEPGACESARGRNVIVNTGAEMAADRLPDSPFARAIQAARILPSQPDNAFAILQSMKGSLAAGDYAALANRLRIELENAGQRVILEYLKGEAIAPKREMFERGAEAFTTARELAPEDDRLFAKELFCRGRAFIFDHNYKDALNALETAIRLDPTGSYAYNAIGLAYLQQGQYGDAESAFLDAIRFAPYWVYPRHNLALTSSERGDFQRAVNEYEAAFSLTPRYAYVAYNLGITLEKMNRRTAARDEFRQALSLDPHMARAHTALGLSYALDGDSGKAAVEYHLALKILEQSPGLDDELAARHNLALLELPSNPDQAIALWNRNLARSGSDLPSLMGLARAYQAAGRTEEAIRACRRIVALQPGYLGARLTLAELLIAGRKLAEADEILEIGRKSVAENATVWELSGDARANDRQRALESYQTALGLSKDKDRRKRIRHKLAALRAR